MHKRSWRTTNSTMTEEIRPPGSSRGPGSRPWPVSEENISFPYWKPTNISTRENMQFNINLTFELGKPKALSLFVFQF